MMFAARLCGLSTLLLLAVAGYRYVTAPPADPPAGQAILVHDLEPDLGELPVGRHPVAVRLTNQSSQPLRVIGMIECCGKGACFCLKCPDQVPLPAHSEVVYECYVDVRRPGPFTCPLALHLEDGGIRTVTLHARGVGVGPTVTGPGT